MFKAWVMHDCASGIPEQNWSGESNNTSIMRADYLFFPLNQKRKKTKKHYLQMTRWGSLARAPASLWAMSWERYLTPAPNDTTTKPCSAVSFTHASKCCRNKKAREGTYVRICGIESKSVFQTSNMLPALTWVTPVKREYLLKQCEWWWKDKYYTQTTSMHLSSVMASLWPWLEWCFITITISHLYPQRKMSCNIGVTVSQMSY